MDRSRAPVSVHDTPEAAAARGLVTVGHEHAAGAGVAVPVHVQQTTHLGHPEKALERLQLRLQERCQQIPDHGLSPVGNRAECQEPVAIGHRQGCVLTATPHVGPPLCGLVETGPQQGNGLPVAAGQALAAQLGGQALLRDHLPVDRAAAVLRPVLDEAGEGASAKGRHLEGLGQRRVDHLHLHRQVMARDEGLDRGVQFQQVVLDLGVLQARRRTAHVVGGQQVALGLQAPDGLQREHGDDGGVLAAAEQRHGAIALLDDVGDRCDRGFHGRLPGKGDDDRRASLGKCFVPHRNSLGGFPPGEMRGGRVPPGRCVADGPEGRSGEAESFRDRWRSRRRIPAGWTNSAGSCRCQGRLRRAFTRRWPWALRNAGVWSKRSVPAERDPQPASCPRGRAHQATCNEFATHAGSHLHAAAHPRSST